MFVQHKDSEAGYISGRDIGHGQVGTISGIFFQDTQSISQQIYNLVKQNNLKDIKFLLGINDDDSNGHLKTQSVDLISIKDSKDNTLLHHAAAQSTGHLFLELLNYATRQNGEGATREWITRTNTSGFMCMHIACNRGHLTILQALKDLGIDLNSKTQIGHTCLHIAAQADQPKILFYLCRELADKINDQDQMKSTPLHQASNYGAELCASILLTLGCDVNAQDNEGNTPLHLCAYSGHYKIARRLLYYGADTCLPTLKGQHAASIASSNEYEKISRLILEYQKGQCSLKCICGTHTKAKKNKKALLQIILFCIIFFFTVSYMFIYTINRDTIGYVQCGAFVYLLILFVFISNSDPGYLPKQREKSDQFLALLQQETLVRSDQICAECFSTKPKRSKHCDFCKRCVSVYDHHCPWINNCIGSRNHFQFMFFIVSLWFILVGSIFAVSYFAWFDDSSPEDLLIKYLVDQLDLGWDGDLFNRDFGILDLQKILAIVLISILGVFLILLTCLLCVQISNVSTNQTTFERINMRHSELRKSRFQESSSDLSTSSHRLLQKNKASNKSITGNCADMLCHNRKNKVYFQVETDYTTSVTTAVISK